MSLVGFWEDFRVGEILKFWKEQFNKGKQLGVKKKEKHKKKIKRIFGGKEDDV